MTGKTFATTATEMHEQLQLLRLERAAAPVADLEDLDDEIASTRTAYVGAAVTEIASLRGQLSDRPQG